jgi:hypothetical protein
VDSDLVFLVDYPCPRCQADLVARVGGVPEWLRCPSCGQASLPPEHQPIAPAPSVETQALVLDSFIANGSSAAATTLLRPMVPLPPPRRVARTPPVKLFLGSGFFLASVMVLISLLDSSTAMAGIYALAAVTCLVFLTRSSRRPPVD